MLLNNVAEAKQFVLDDLNAEDGMLASGDAWTIVDTDTLEREYGWIFNCQSRKYIETGDSTYCVKGLGGVVVDRDGSIHLMACMGSRKTRFRVYDARRNPTLLRRFIAVIYELRDIIFDYYE